MLRILQQAILTTLFAVFASQASAMFISPDPMDPTGPGVGTNRYAYSLGDPVNRSDRSGYDSVWQNGDGTWSSSDGSTWDPETRTGSYDFGSSEYGYLTAPGLSPVQIPGVQTEDNRYGGGTIANIENSGNSTVLSVTYPDYNDSSENRGTVTGYALYNRTSYQDTGVGSLTHSRLQQDVYNAAGGPGYVGPRILATGLTSVAGPVVITRSGSIAVAGAGYVKKNTSFDGPGKGLAYGNGRVFGVRW